MVGRGRHHGPRHNPQHTLSSVARETAISLPADSPVLHMFKTISSKLNERQDRHERLVKLSRDITIESKRIIFLLHSSITKESADKIIREAGERLQKLIDGPIKSIGLELEKIPANLHSRAVTGGFQEFIEAITFCCLMSKKDIITWSELQDKFNYTIQDKNNDVVTERKVVTLVPQLDYMLGVADVTGELMRKAINSISSGDSEECFHSCQVVRNLYTGYLGLFGAGKELARKMSTTRMNVYKVEAAVYALRVRGGEAPAQLLLPAGPAPHIPTHAHDWDTATASDDEGYF